MTPERLQQIEELYHSALERDSAERVAFINDSCNGDEELRWEVESLLASHERAGDFIEAPVHEAAARLIADNRERSMVGRAIGRYEIIELLGAGGMGEVYLARDKTLGRQVALKLLPDYFTQDEARVRRFQQEARTASGLNHPNILTIYEISQLGGQHFIATEFIDGETLRDRMAHTRAKLGEALEIATQVGAALAAADEAGIAHRDIKPENIMIRRDGYVKVLDFGLAKLTEHESVTVDAERATRVPAKTDPGMVMGTVQYMSPEQARGLTVDGRTDIWSIGVVLYEMVTGEAPFAGETPSHVIVSILEKEAPLLSRCTPEAPAELERIVDKALRKNRDERYQTVKDLLLDLKSLKQELAVEAHIERSSAPERFALRSSSAEYIVNQLKDHKRSATLVFATLLIAVTALVYFFYFAKRGEAIDSVAVLPFVNMSGDPNTEYLSDGLSDSIISSLSQLSTLKVISQSSTLRYKGRPIDPKQVGQELGVRAVLMGRLVQRGDDLSVSTELVDVRDNRRLWAHQYNRKLADIIAMQEDISLEISEKLRARLSPEERKQLEKHYTENIEAYKAFLQGYHYLLGAEAEKSIEYFEEAIRIDPSFAPAYAALARAYYGGDNFAQLPQESRKKIESALRKAQELDGNLADVHALLGAIRQDQDDWPEAEKEFKRAIELNPNGKGVHWYYARYLSAIGRNDEAIAEAKRGLEIDPLSPLRVAIVAYYYLHARQYDQAIELYRKALEMDPNYAWAHANLGRAYVQKGMHKEAVAELQKATALNPQLRGKFEAALGYAYAVSGKKAEAKKILGELNERAKQSHIEPVNFAIIYTGLGDKDRAFEWLEKAYKDRPGPPYLAIDLMLDSLRSDPRFVDLARRKGLAS
jgi:serine/threonine protein kinase/Tfp pilus assembly protein PilF